MKANFGLLPKPEHDLPKSERYVWYKDRALTAMRRFTRAAGIRYNREAAEGTQSRIVNR
jgi:hypothetical protein